MYVNHILGNTSFSNLNKTVFLCSQRVPAYIVLKSYDWAIAQRENGHCIISGFHSKIEKDVLHFLLKGSQPVILALARGLKKKYDPEIQEALLKNRLAIISSFEENIKRVTVETARQRNLFMCDLADDIFVAFASPNGNLFPLVKKCISRGRLVKSFDVPENEHLFEIGVERYAY